MITPREFAIDVVRQLQDAGHQALFAGGCVRDQLMGNTPKDYDVATSATPPEVQALFGKRRTLAIGASFGVVAVVGPKSAGTVEVATFRRDGGYSDGRHPDSVEFTNAQEDAQRRDFTINGLFFDPIAEVVHDYVEGRRDIDERVIRAIGKPHDRFHEDKLRMLRAIRFAATFNFELDSGTRKAIAELGEQINIVSGERIGNEMKRMMGHPNRHLAAALLGETRLLERIVPGGELETLNRANWKSRLKWLRDLVTDDFEPAVVLLLMNSLKELGVAPVAESWKFATSERKSIEWISEHWLTLSRAKHLPWSQIQPLLVHADAHRALKLAETVLGNEHVGVQVAKQRLSWPPEKLNPRPMLDGGDLLAMGMKSGPVFSRILGEIRAKQLDGEIVTREQAVQFALELAKL
ncbi:MAG: CCA tRNA nucleotidyltransferase [Pirellulaceae bacterium]